MSPASADSAGGPAARPGRSNLQTRLLTAGLLLPIPLLIFIYGSQQLAAFALLMCLTLCVAEAAMMIIPVFEWRVVVGAPGGEVAKPTDTGLLTSTGKRWGLPLTAVALGWGVFIAQASGASGSAEEAVGCMALAMMLALLIGAFSSRRADVAAARAFGLLVSLGYGAMPWLVIWLLYLKAPHARYVILVMATAWAGDTGGYFGGRFLGGKIFGDRKMAPTISPKKTWEGALCGLIGSVFGVWLINSIYRLVLNQYDSWLLLAVMAAVAGAFGQLGDLVESAFKRFSGVKDSGGIFPGHGGFLDRVDAILFAAPVIWVILHYFR